MTVMRQRGDATRRVVLRVSCATSEPASVIASAASVPAWVTASDASSVTSVTVAAARPVKRWVALAIRSPVDRVWVLTAVSAFSVASRASSTMSSTRESSFSL